MKELKACAFCGGKANLRCASVIVGRKKYFVSCHDCNTSTSRYFDTLDDAITAWNRRTAPENKPLTLEQLREVDGDPVWVETGEVIIREQIVGAWRILDTVNNLTADFSDGGYRLLLNHYGKTWLTYPRKPKQEDES